MSVRGQRVSCDLRRRRRPWGAETPRYLLASAMSILFLGVGRLADPRIGRAHLDPFHQVVDQLRRGAAPWGAFPAPLADGFDQQAVVRIPGGDHRSHRPPFAARRAYRGRNCPWPSWDRRNGTCSNASTRDRADLLLERTRPLPSSDAVPAIFGAAAAVDDLVVHASQSDKRSQCRDDTLSSRIPIRCSLMKSRKFRGFTDPSTLGCHRSRSISVIPNTQYSYLINTQTR